MPAPPLAGPVVPADQLTFDPLAPFPELAQVAQAAHRRDWAGVVTSYQQLGGWDLRTAAIRLVGEAAGSERFLQPAVAASAGGDDLAATMLAARLIEIGWHVRTGRRAKYVSRKRFAVFHDHLRRAEQLLIDVTAHDPANLAAWTLRMRTARGLQLGQAETRRRYEQVARHDPNHMAAQAQLFVQLCPKLGGTFESLHAFVDECARVSPPGSLNAALVVEAHLEHWITLNAYKGMAGYLREVAPQVSRLAEHSVLHPQFRRAYNWVDAHATFALFHCLARNFAAAAPHFRALGNYGSTRLWDQYTFGPKRRFRRDRGRALEQG